MIAKLRKILGMETNEEKLNRFHETNNSIACLSKKIDDLAEEFTVKNESFKSLLKSNNFDDQIKKNIQSRYNNFIDYHKKELQPIIKERRELRKQHEQLLKDSSLFKAIREINIIGNAKDKYVNGDINREGYDLILKATQGKVSYSDIIIFNEEGKILLLQRANEEGDNFSNMWCVPGGHVDAGEDFAEAAQRELWEEAGIYCNDLKEIGIYTDDNVEIHYFKGSVDSNEVAPTIQSTEMQDYKWVAFHEIGGYEMPKNMKANILKVDNRDYFIDKDKIKIIKSLFDEDKISKSMFDDLLEKSFSGDLSKRFPNGGWRTINGAKVFINGGKVVAGLDGFNGMINDFFKEKAEKEKLEKEPNKTKGKIDVKVLHGYIENINDNIGSPKNEFKDKVLAGIPKESLAHKILSDAKYKLSDKQKWVVAFEIQKNPKLAQDIADESEVSYENLGKRKAQTGEVMGYIAGLNPRTSTVSSMGTFVTSQAQQVADYVANEVRGYISQDSLAYKIMDESYKRTGSQIYTEKQIEVIAKELMKNDEFRQKVAKHYDEIELREKMKSDISRSKKQANKENSQPYLDAIKEKGEKLGDYYKWLNDTKNPYRKEFFSKKYSQSSVNAFLESQGKQSVDIKVSDVGKVETPTLKVDRTNFEKIDTQASNVKSNDIVRHSKFGEGKVISVTDDKIEIDFNGEKKAFAPKFVKFDEVLRDKSDNGDSINKSIEEDLLEKAEKIIGGLADDMSIEDIAKKHKTPLTDMLKQYIKGIEVEMEHTDDKNKASEIAKDHLFEIPDYYTRLEKMEKEGKDKINSLIEKGLISESLGVQLIEKARTGTYSDNATNRRLKRVGQEYGSKKQEEQTVDKEKKEDEPEKDGKQPSIEEHARTASETALQNAAKGGDEELRVAAKKELERREKEESPAQQEEQDSKESPIDEASSNIEEELNKKDDTGDDLDEKGVREKIKEVDVKIESANERLKEKTEGLSFLQKAKAKSEDKEYSSLIALKKEFTDKLIELVDSKKESDKKQKEGEKQKESEDLSKISDHKKKQFEIIQETNPMLDDYHVGIRSPKDIKSFEETINDDESFSWGDFSQDDAKKALNEGEITLYSSKPIKQGGFVSTSKSQAEQYAGGAGKKVYSKKVKLEDVAWINGDEGQYTELNNNEIEKSEKMENELSNTEEKEISDTQLNWKKWL